MTAVMYPGIIGFGKRALHETGMPGATDAVQCFCRESRLRRPRSDYPAGFHKAWVTETGGAMAYLCALDCSRT